MIGPSRAVACAGLLALLAACPRPIPAHLALAPPADPGAPGAQGPIDTLDDALRAMVAEDALVRAVRFLPLETLEGLEHGAALAAFVDEVQVLERQQLDIVPALQRLTVAWPGTPVTAFARGYRLHKADTLLATFGASSHATALRGVGPLLSPLREDDNPDGLAINPLSFLSQGAEFTTASRAYGDRWVATGWLDGPTIPLGAVADALASNTFDQLRVTPIGQLILARAEARRGPTEAGFAMLERATALSLERAAADRDGEQGRYSDHRREVAEELGHAKPIAWLLEQARLQLTDAAGDDRAAGSALLAFEASRYGTSCRWDPCAGLDRVEAMLQAASWHPEVNRLARIWAVIAVKDALDGMDVGHDTVLFPHALVDLVDALVGTGAAPPPASIMSRRVADPVVWAELGASVGEDGVTSWNETQVAIGRHLASVTAEARALNSVPDLDALLMRIHRRAVP